MNIPNTFAINIGMYNEKYLNILRKVYLKYNIWENYLYNFDKYLFTINYYDDKTVSNTENDIENFKLIYHLAKEQGYSLEGVRKRLREKPKETITNSKIISRLESIKTELIKIKNQL